MSVNGIYYAFSVSPDYAATFTWGERKKACLGKRESRPTYYAAIASGRGKSKFILHILYIVLSRRCSQMVISLGYKQGYKQDTYCTIMMLIEHTLPTEVNRFNYM